MSKQKFSGSNAKGYYIALALCAVAIGICGILYYNTNEPQPQLNDPDITLDANATLGGEDVQAGVTVPVQTDTTTPTTTTPQTQSKPMQTMMPVVGETISQYAMECLQYNPTTRDWRVHNGIDIAAEAGTQVCAAAAGTVYTVYDDETMGMTVVIRHNDGYTTHYSSLEETVSVKPGDAVTMGQVIGCVGQTALMESAIGDHVHFSVTHNDQVIDPAVFLHLA